MSKKVITFSIQKKPESKCVKNKDPFHELDTKSLGIKKKKSNEDSSDIKKNKPSSIPRDLDEK